jgi:hypothetical protein
MLQHRWKEENPWEREKKVRAGCKAAKAGKSFDGRRL